VKDILIFFCALSFHSAGSLAKHLTTEEEIKGSWNTERRLTDSVVYLHQQRKEIQIIDKCFLHVVSTLQIRLQAYEHPLAPSQLFYIILKKVIIMKN
jgi:hypothetical protein